MNPHRRISMLGISALLAVGLAACDNPGAGPAESVGKKIDQAASDAGKTLGAAADKAGQKLEQQSMRTGVDIDDTEITAKVKAAIFAEPGLKTLQISVITVKGVVTLSGSADSQSSSDRAKALAGAVGGVSAVDNRLVFPVKS